VLTAYLSRTLCSCYFFQHGLRFELCSKGSWFLHDAFSLPSLCFPERRDHHLSDQVMAVSLSEKLLLTRMSDLRPRFTKSDVC